MTYVINQILQEKVQAVAAHGGETHDDGHTISDWVALLTRHAGLAVDDGEPNASMRFRKQMIRVAALALAAVESHDRKNEKPVPKPDDFGKGW